MNDNDMRINTDRAQTASSLKALTTAYTIAARARYDLTGSCIPIELYSTEHYRHGCEKIHIPEDAAVKAAYQNFLDELIRYYEYEIAMCTAQIGPGIRTFDAKDFRGRSSTH